MAHLQLVWLTGHMAKDLLRYDRMVEQAYRGIVREALVEVAEHGLPGAHHFYISFRTQAPGVDIPDHLVGQYPNEMTVVLEHQFWGLEVDSEKFGVTLSFGSRAERLIVPFAAVTSFADPSVKFALQFQEQEVEYPAALPTPSPKPAMAEEAARTDEAPGQISQLRNTGEKGEPAASPPEEAPKDKVGEVITLDSFRKR